VLLHGDAAFIGQGVVAETLNLSQLRGYRTGGTIHLVINNQIGFTTSSRDARSTFFPTDLVKMLPVPVFHVNGDDPEAVVYAVDLALRYRQTFGLDAVIDILCYRRHGHNEGDEPSFTHPRMYRLIKDHPGVATIYGARCEELGIMSKEDRLAFRTSQRQRLKTALAAVRANPTVRLPPAAEGDWAGLSTAWSWDPVDTRVEEAALRRIAAAVGTPPEGFSLHPKLARILQERSQRVATEGGVDWTFAETLAFGSLLLEGTGIRLSGQDSARGTFSQRHAVWWDTDSPTPRPHTPLNSLDPRQALFSVYDSPLSEYSVLAFEYGYSLYQPRMLVIWEAQFGDFANGAEVVIDSYVAAAESKWGRRSGLVMLLPHGYEGQGPDHSDAHVERYLQLCAEDNLQVCNATTPAQYFHLLRRQVRQGFRKPLILMAPKSLLRHPKAVSPIGELATGSFRVVLDEPARPAGGRRLLFCSGKVFYDLDARRQKLGRTDTAIVRVEQLYPFPQRAIAEALDRHPKVRETLWVQEEPENRGPWTFVKGMFERHFGSVRLVYAGRPASASSATGSHAEHAREQERLLEAAMGG
jgi:2-oxoglutarate dehydrogenase E1 component